MREVLVTGESGSVGRRGIVWLLAVGREARTILRSQTLAADVRAMSTTTETQPVARASVVASERDRNGGWPDTVAGCEFVDDRIRLTE